MKLFRRCLGSGAISASQWMTLAAHLPQSGWHHIAAVKTAGRLTLHVDGKQVAESAAFDASSWNLDSEAPLRLGTGMNGPFNGQLADLQIHRRKLTAEEIKEMAARQPGK